MDSYMFESKVMRLGQDSDSNSDLKYTQKKKNLRSVALRIANHV